MSITAWKKGDRVRCVISELKTGIVRGQGLGTVSDVPDESELAIFLGPISPFLVEIPDLQMTIKVSNQSKAHDCFALYWNVYTRTSRIEFSR